MFMTLAWISIFIIFAIMVLPILKCHICNKRSTLIRSYTYKEFFICRTCSNQYKINTHDDCIRIVKKIASTNEKGDTNE
jgi:hypothetical protein